MATELENALIANLKNSLMQLNLQLYESNLQIEEASVSTGNRLADDELKRQETIATGRVALLSRQITVRQGKLAALTAGLGDTAVTAGPSVPPPTFSNV